MRRQQGMVLLLVVLSVLAAGGAIVMMAMLTGPDAGQRRTSETLASYDILSVSRDALFGSATAVSTTGTRPGQLPKPDTLQNGTYDGQIDLGCLDAAAANGIPALTGTGAQSANLRCLGRLPWAMLGVAIKDASVQDSAGAVPWYAVSQNLADPNSCMNVLNSQTASMTTSSYACNTTTGPAWPWIKVCDADGRIVSDRVAFVLIQPGPPITTQGRTQTRSATGGSPKDFLDALPVPAAWSSIPAASRCSAFDNAGLTDEFVIGKISDAFNDRVLYVTIDDLMEQVEKRVAVEVAKAMETHKTLTTGYPWLATLTNPTVPTTATLAVAGTRSGLVPFVARSGSTSNAFLTELNWAMSPTTSASDTLSGAATSTPTFYCYSGTYQCRLRTTGSAAIPRTITSAAMRTGSTPTPNMSCTYSYNVSNVLSGISCTDATVTTTSLVTYRVERRSCLIAYVFCSGGYALVANHSGTQTRTITLTGLTSTQSSGSPAITGASASTIARRTITSASQPLFNLVQYADSWTPAAAGVAPFDVSSGPFLAWTGSTNSSGTLALNARVHPDLPAWYFSERWYELVYAAVSDDSKPIGANGASATCTTNCFTSGSRTGLDVVTIVGGPVIGSQNRTQASPAIGDFLESLNTTGASTRSFAATSIKRSASYADTIATIPR